MSIKVEEIVETGRRRRRRHSEQFKAEAVQACQVPGVSVAAVALARGLNANMLRSWIKLMERAKAVIAIQPDKRAAAALPVEEAFVPVALPTGNPASAVIRIEIHRKDRRVSIEWPATESKACAIVLHEILK